MPSNSKRPVDGAAAVDAIATRCVDAVHALIEKELDRLGVPADDRFGLRADSFREVGRRLS